MKTKRAFSHHTRWSESEIAILRSMYRDASWRELLDRLPGRSRSMITCKANGLALIRYRAPKRTPEQVREAKRLSMRKQRMINPQRCAEIQLAHYQRNREHVLRRNREWSHRHFFRNKASRRCGATASELFELWKSQRGRCALTGRKLDRTAHLDHILPKARGGIDHIDNYRWVCREANMVKRDLTDDEFVALCRDCMEWIGERIAAQEAA